MHHHHLNELSESTYDRDDDSSSKVPIIPPTRRDCRKRE
jgi:hypothetical protein